MSRASSRAKYLECKDAFDTKYKELLAASAENNLACMKEPPNENYIPDYKIRNLKPVKEFYACKNLGDYRNSKPEVFFATRTHYCDVLDPFREDVAPSWAEFVYFLKG